MTRFVRWQFAVLAALCAIAVDDTLAATDPGPASLRTEAAAPAQMLNGSHDLDSQLARATGSAARRVRSAATLGMDAPQGQGVPPDWDTVTANGFDLCGDGVIDDIGEQCDGADFGGATCESLGLGSGNLACSKTGCRLFSQCYVEWPVCTIQNCAVDSDCEADCGPCDHFGDGPGYCRGTTGGSGQ